MSDGEVVNEGRRKFLTAATSVVGAAGAVGFLVPFVGSWNPSAKAKAAGAPVTINLAKIAPGQMITEEWRGKPVYVVRRTQEALDGLKKVTNDFKMFNNSFIVIFINALYFTCRIIDQFNRVT